MLQFARVIGLVLLVAVALPLPALAQTSSITGTVTDATSGARLSSTRVVLTSSTGVALDSAITNEDGQFRIGNVAPGTYSLLFTRIGYSPVRALGVQVASGIPAIQGAQMIQSVPRLSDQIVVGGTRTEETVVRTPVSVHVVGQRAIEQRPSLTVPDHLDGAPGVHISRGGLVQSNIVARGFNNAFSGAMLMLVDNRFASVPSLRVNVPALFTVTNDDIERVETILGPASALYGPNSANGVLAVFTKSPFDSRGTTLSVEAGDRGIFKGSVRAAAVLANKLGIKLSFEKMTGTDFHYVDSAETGTGLRPSAPGQPRVPTPISRDYKVDRSAGELRVDYRDLGSDTKLTASYGQSQLGNGIELTSPNGAVQGHNWVYSHVQFRATHKGLFAQAFTNFSNAGNSDSLDTRGTFFLRTGNPIVDNSRIHAFQVQQRWEVTPSEQLIFGVDYIKTDPQTKGTINGRYESDDNVTEYGAYVHSRTQLSPKFDLVAALRTDYQSVVDDQLLAPRVGIVFMPDTARAFRLTYNRAQFTPANFAFFLDFQLQRLDPRLPYFARALGNKDGFTYRRDCAQGTQGLCMKSPFNATPTTYVNAGGTDLYRAGLAVAGPALQQQLTAQVGAMQAGQIMAFLGGLTPTDQQVGGRLQVVVPSVGFQPVTSTWNDFAALAPERYDVIELGYKGDISTKGYLAADVWFQRRHNFTGPASNISPSVFITPATLGAYLTTQLTPVVGAAQAAVIAGALSGGLTLVPLGTVVPDHEFATNSDVLFSYYQVRDDVDLYGIDLAFDYKLTNHFSVAGTYSWVSEDFFPDVFGEGIEPLSLNAADNKGTLTVGFRDENLGFNTDLRVRYANTFPVSSGVYQGKVPVNAFLDLTASYRIPGKRNMLFGLSVTNILDNKKPTFIGVPSMGRLAMGRFQITF